MCKLHGDKSLTWKTFNSPGLIINLDPCQFHINLSLNKVPLIVIERYWGLQCNIENPIPNHENECKVMGG